MDMEKLLNSIIIDGDTKISVRDFYNRMGSSDFDFDKYLESGMLPEILRLGEHFLTHSDPQECVSEETLAYWAERGLKKEYVTDPDGDYIVFSPLNPEPGRKYPMLFTIYGGNPNLYFVETLGFTHLAAEEQLIQVIPVIEFPDREPRMDRDRPYELLDKLTEAYPVDESRIYMTGFSHGGILSQWNGIAHFERFAGICPSGIRPGDGGPRRPGVGPSFMIYYDYPVTEELVHAHVPVVYCIGMAEQPEHIPLYHENHAPVFEHYIDEHVSMLKPITRMNETPDIDEATLRACAESEDPCERVIGLPLTNTHIETYFGAKHYFGDVPGRDGVVRTRFIAVENQPHHPSAAWARLSWDFISKFRRDPVTHESIYEA